MAAVECDTISPRQSFSAPPQTHQLPPFRDGWALRLSPSPGPLQAQFYNPATGQSLALYNKSFNGQPQLPTQAAWDLVDMATINSMIQHADRAFLGAPWVLLDAQTVRLANPAEQSDLPQSFGKLGLSSPPSLPTPTSPFSANGLLTPPAEMSTLQPVHSVDAAGIQPPGIPSPMPTGAPPLNRAVTQPAMPVATTPAGGPRAVSRRPVGGAPARKLAPPPSTLPPHQAPSPRSMASPPSVTSRGISPVSPQSTSPQPPHVPQHSPVPSLASVAPTTSSQPAFQQVHYQQRAPSVSSPPGVSAASSQPSFQQPRQTQQNSHQAHAAPYALTPAQQFQQASGTISQQSVGVQAAPHVTGAMPPQSFFPPPPSQHPSAPRQAVPNRQTNVPMQQANPQPQAMPAQPRHSVPNTTHHQQRLANQTRAMSGGHQAGAPASQPFKHHANVASAASAAGPPQYNNEPMLQQASAPSSSIPQAYPLLTSKRESLSAGFGKMKKMMKHPVMKHPAAKYAMKLGTGLVIGSIIGGSGADGLIDAFSGDSGGGDVGDVFVSDDVTVETDTIDVGGDEVTVTEVDTTTIVEDGSGGYEEIDTSTVMVTDVDYDAGYAGGGGVYEEVDTTTYTSTYDGYDTTAQSATFTEVDTTTYTTSGFDTTSQAVAITGDAESTTYTSTYAGFDSTSHAAAITSDAAVTNDSWAHNSGSSSAWTDQQMTASANENLDANAAQLGMEYRGRENALALI